MTTERDDLLTVTEVADLLRVPVATVRWWRHNRTGPRSFKIGRHVLYQRSDITAYIAQQREHDGADPA
jgi:excisionase family DNA binding protein